VIVEIIKAGISDTFQDAGRYGYQHLGVNPSGAMDITAMKIANALVGNKLNEAVIETCFPASIYYFKQPAIIALSGADFSAKVNGKNIVVNQPIVVGGDSELTFTHKRSGNFSYLAVRGGFSLALWLNSASTNVKAGIGGFKGRALLKGDTIEFNEVIAKRETQILPWHIKTDELYTNNGVVRCIQGNEFDWLTNRSQQDFLNEKFVVKATSDRMGLQVAGHLLEQNKKQELLSTAVTFGTVQLLPAGELIILMADHQTTGGYPRIAHVISADKGTLAQHAHNKEFSFKMVSIEEAENWMLQQNKIINQLQYACARKLDEFLKMK
jgi:antagonist of KipI